MRHVRVILAFAVFVCSVAPGEAASLMLKDLITNNGALVQGDTLFNDFNIQIASTSGLAFPAIDTIAVEGITRNGEHGLRFAGSLSALGQPEGGSGASVGEYRLARDGRARSGGCCFECSSGAGLREGVSQTGK